MQKRVTLRFENMFLYINRLNVHYFSFDRKAMNIKIVYKLLISEKKRVKVERFQMKIFEIRKTLLLLDFLLDFSKFCTSL